MLVFIYINLSECIFADLTCHCDCRDGHTLGILQVVLLMDKDFVPKNLDCISYLILYITFDILYDYSMLVVGFKVFWGKIIILTRPSCYDIQNLCK